jgi:hypothetical protein
MLADTSTLVMLGNSRLSALSKLGGCGAARETR